MQETTRFSDVYHGTIPIQLSHPDDLVPRVLVKDVSVSPEHECGAYA